MQWLGAANATQRPQGKAIRSSRFEPQIYPVSLPLVEFNLQTSPV